MRSERTDKLRPTAFDIVAAALAPALIIGMIGSLVFFLVIAFYRGEYDVRLMYILGLFTLATVLIARIAIESGRAHANAFAAPLAIVALIAMFRFVTVPGGLEAVGGLLNIGLLALVWFLADRITFDCTLLEEDRESVQGGLLQTLGVPERSGSQPAPAAKSAPVVAVKKRSKHNPGVWVLYFALLAFPLFGLGQLAIPTASERSKAFWLLVIYLGCALGLLTSTSLLALRRYLRQRGVEMPVEITARWLATGVGLAVAVLLLCILLPLPGRSLGLVGLPFEITSPDNLAPSRFGIGNDGQQTEPYGTPRASQQQEEQQEQPAQGDAQRQAEQDKPSADGKNGDQAKPARDGQTDQQGQQKPRQPDADRPASDQSRTSQPSDQSSNAEKPVAEKPDAQESAEQARRDESERPDAAQPAQEKDESTRARDRQTPEQDRGDAKPREDQAQPARPTTAEKPPAADRESQQPAAPEQRPQQAQPPASSSSNYSFVQQLSELGGRIGQWFKWLTIAVLAAIVVLYVLTHPGEIAKLWRSLLDFLAMLFGGKRVGREESAVADAASAAAQSRPRFAAFANPFAKNLRGWQAPQVVEHTFAALEAWAAEHGRARQVDQTAEEFAKRLSVDIPQLGKLPIIAAGMLDRVMFAGWQPTNAELAPLAELWRCLESLQFLTAEVAEIAELKV